MDNPNIMYKDLKEQVDNFVRVTDPLNATVLFQVLTSYDRMPGDLQTYFRAKLKSRSEDVL